MTAGDPTAQLNRIRSELARSRGLAPYEAIDVAWVAVVKAANLLQGHSEHERMLALLDHLPEDSVRSVLKRPTVDALLNLTPPLESLLSATHERLNATRTAAELEIVRVKRETDSKEAL